MRGITRNGGILIFPLVFLLTLSLMGLPGQEKIKYTSSAEVEYTSREVKEIGDQEGHILALSTVEGIQKSTDEILDGAKLTLFSFADLVMGNGLLQAYTKMEKDGSVAYLEYKGKVTTTMVEGQPLTTYETAGKILTGSGIYKGMQGEFTAKATQVTENKIVIEVKGEYTIK